jgi:Zn-dependent peptidase ImmA (M78 family)
MRKELKYIKSVLPKTINVLGTDFTIKFSWRMEKTQGLPTYAITYGDDRIIVINARKVTNLKVFKSTLIHELLHAALHIGGVTQLFTEEQEEALCSCLEGFLMTHMDFTKFDLKEELPPEHV